MKYTILAVDDEPKTLNLLNLILKDQYDMKYAENGRTALEGVVQHRPDLIILDIVMSDMNGFEVCRQLKKNPITAKIPIMFLSALTSAEDFKKGLALGALYYLRKPIDRSKLVPLVGAAVEEFQRLKSLEFELSKVSSAFSLTDSWEVSFRTLEDAKQIAGLAAKAFPDPVKIANGLLELLTNAVEHGIALITYDEKTQLMNEQLWSEEVSKRLMQKKNKGKYAKFKMKRQKRQIEVVVKDPGPGFDWKNYLDFDLKRVSDTHGRGVATANKLCFDSLHYEGNGNTVVAICSNK